MRLHHPSLDDCWSVAMETTPTTTKDDEAVATIRDSIQKVMSRIRETARSRKATKLPSAEFSLAVNAVGECFVDLLLQKERKGNWWLTDNGEWVECCVKSNGMRIPRNFLRGQSSEWKWFPQSQEIRHLADRMTGPDHLIVATVGSLNLTANIVLEQKLRFGTKQDAFADASTYVKHLLDGVKGDDRKKLPKPRTPQDVTESYFEKLLGATKSVLLKTKGEGVLAHSGSVPHVCFVSLQTPPHKIFVCDREYRSTTECDFVGFLAPTVNDTAFAADSVNRRIIERAKVRLWIGLDSLLEQCDCKEVEAAWTTAIDGLSASVRNPKWSE